MVKIVLVVSADKFTFVDEKGEEIVSYGTKAEAMESLSDHLNRVIGWMQGGMFNAKLCG